MDLILTEASQVIEPGPGEGEQHATVAGLLQRLAPCNVTSTPHFWPPILSHQITFPLVPNICYIGRVRNCACGQH